MVSVRAARLSFRIVLYSSLVINDVFRGERQAYMVISLLCPAYSDYREEEEEEGWRDGIHSAHHYIVSTYQFSTYSTPFPLCFRATAFLTPPLLFKEAIYSSRCAA